MIFFNESDFINKQITGRATSLFQNDINNNWDLLEARVNGKSILVIGGAGTIGSSFIKAILKFKPSELSVVDYSENGLTELTRDLRSNKDILIPEKYITYPFDFGGPIFEKFVSENNFDIVACFAAHKHVRSEKDHLAIEAMIRNNVFNTQKLLELLSKNIPSHFFSVSTDKAANPVNVMGASKKLMEKVLLAHSRLFKITTARFANVAFSNGSLLAGFIQRVMKRQPLSSPSDVKRYFVSPEESGELCMLACLMGDSGDIFFPKLDANEMKKFSSIAEAFLSALGLECDYCDSEEEAKAKAHNWTPQEKKYPVYFFETDTDGEKMYEEFFVEEDIIDNSSFSALGVITGTPDVDIETIRNILAKFEEMFQTKNVQKENLIALLKKYIPDFNHSETGKNLDQRM
jgi:FlaA1/EpsC-like NDP-sugar epimerase